MLKSIWFMIKTGILISAAIWIAERPGAVDVAWGDYKITAHLGIALLLLTLFILLSILVYRLVHIIFSAPEAFTRRQERRRFQLGYHSLTLGLTAVAAGDAKKASEHAKRVSKYWPEDNGIPVLLQAQAARLSGDNKKALQHFAHLAEDKDAGFLGVRGLLQAALDEGRSEKALELAKHALKSYPKQKWLLNLVYDLEIQLRLWKDAFATLDKIKKYEALKDKKIKSDYIAILLSLSKESFATAKDSEALHYLKKAYKADPSYPPSVVALTRYYIGKGKRSSAVKVLEEGWRLGGHPSYILLWDSLVPKTKSIKKAFSARLSWFEKLLVLNDESADVYFALSRVTLEQKLYGQARDYLQRAENLEHSSRIYKLRASIEESAGAEDSFVRMWLERAADAPKEKCWVCERTGRIYEEWKPIADPHGSFNTIKWQVPMGQEAEIFLPVTDSPVPVLDSDLAAIDLSDEEVS